MEVPAIGMGTWRTFDTDGDRRPLVDAALAAGIDLFDSSPMYGAAETALGRALEGRREKALVATKIWSESAEEGRRQAELALRIYGTVDVYQVHNLAAWPEQLAMLEGLRDAGRVRALGATHHRPDAYPELCRVMRTGRVDMVQLALNPLAREAEQEVLPLARELGLGVFAHSPLRSGVLERQPAADMLRELGVVTWAEAVLGWVAGTPGVTTALTATSRPERAAENAAAGRPPFLAPEQRALVERIARG